MFPRIPTVQSLLSRWHTMLSLTRQTSPTWHQERVREELIEREEAETALLKLSETSDVFFAISRAKYDGFPVRELPTFTYRHLHIYAYMVGKYTLRWGFYRVAARLCGVTDYKSVREVVNPGKDSKLDAVASRHQIDPEKFKSVCGKLRWVWPLLP